MTCIICTFKDEVPNPLGNAGSAKYDAVLIAALVAGMTLKEPLKGVCPPHNVMVHSCVAAVTAEDGPCP